MAAPNNLTLLFLSFSLLLCVRFARPDLASPSPFPGPEPESYSDLVPVPSPSPSPEPESSSGSVPVPSPSPSPEPESSSGSVPIPSPSPGLGPISSPTPKLGIAPPPTPELGPITSPTLGSEPGPSPSPEADGPTESDGSAQFDFSTTLAPTAGVSPKVKEICDSTDHPDLCLATVVPRLDGDSGVPTVLEIAIRAGSELAKIGLSLAKTIAESPGVPLELASVLRDCRDSYDDTVYNYENTIDAFPRRDKGTMKSMLSAVITDVGDCEDAFSGYGEESPFSSVADRLTNMTSNCLAIVSLLG